MLVLRARISANISSRSFQRPFPLTVVTPNVTRNLCAVKSGEQAFAVREFLGIRRELNDGRPPDEFADSISYEIFQSRERSFRDACPSTRILVKIQLLVLSTKQSFLIHALSLSTRTTDSDRSIFPRSFLLHGKFIPVKKRRKKKKEGNSTLRTYSCRRSSTTWRDDRIKVERDK